MSLNINTPLKSSSWYLAASKPKQETRAIQNLLNQGINAYSPMMNVEKLRANKKHIVLEAMFTGYVFINLSPEDDLWHKVKSTRGIRDWVRFAGNAAKLPVNLVESFIQQEKSSAPITVKSYFNSGESVRILSGPFKGLTGIYQTSSGEERSIILLNFLGKENALKVENQQITAD